jgi:hypothetical protein
MDGDAAVSRKKSLGLSAESAGKRNLEDRLERLLREAAEVEVALSRADGTIQGVPHYSVIEGRAHELGKRLSRVVQQRQMGEVVAQQATMATCPGCGTRCGVQSHKRSVKSVDGPLELPEVVGYCRRCRRSFFPAAGDVGL